MCDVETVAESQDRQKHETELQQLRARVKVLEAHVRRAANGHLAVANAQREGKAALAALVDQDHIDFIDQAIKANEKNAALHLAALKQAKEQQ